MISRLTAGRSHLCFQKLNSPKFALIRFQSTSTEDESSALISATQENSTLATGKPKIPIAKKPRSQNYANSQKSTNNLQLDAIPDIRLPSCPTESISVDMMLKLKNQESNQKSDQEDKGNSLHFMEMFRKQRLLQKQQADETLQQLLANNQRVRDWARTHKRSNGSMHPSEHQEFIPAGIGQITVFAKRNNTFCTLTDWEHKILRTVSAGMCDLRGWNRGTSEAGTRTASRIGQVAVDKGFRQVYVTLKGFGPGREPAFRSLIASGLQIVSIRDRTPVQHGGCRPKKARRV